MCDGFDFLCTWNVIASEIFDNSIPDEVGKQRAFGRFRTPSSIVTVSHEAVTKVQFKHKNLYDIRIYSFPTFFPCVTTAFRRVDSSWQRIIEECTGQSSPLYLVIFEPHGTRLCKDTVAPLIEPSSSALPLLRYALANE